MTEDLMHLSGFVEGNPGDKWTVGDLEAVLNIPESRLRRWLDEGVIPLLTAESMGRTVYYRSTAEAAPYTDLGLEEERLGDGDILGEQARADFFELGRRRRQNIRRGAKAIEKF